MIKRRTKPRRVAVERDKRYLDYLHAEGKCTASTPGRYCASTIDPAHYRVNGIGSKGSDLQAIPLCRFHHDEMERLRWPAFCLKYNLDRPALVAYWNEKYTKDDILPW